MQHVIIGDVHLTRDHSEKVARDLATVVAQNRGASVVFAGDMIDLAAESVRESSAPAIRSVLGAHEALRSALAGHVAGGGNILLLGGNHDDELATATGVQAFVDGLGLDSVDSARVRSTPWFARLGEGGWLHVEHGHHYDPDNAQPHPLAPPDPSWHSLGIGMMHRFVAPSGAHALVHSNDATPLQCLVLAFEMFGPRAPSVILQYFKGAIEMVQRAGHRYPLAAARTIGDAALDAFAAQWERSPEEVRQMVANGPTPTMASLRGVLMRLYWDRVAAAGVMTVAGTSALMGGPGRVVAVAAAGTLVASMVFGKNRYRGRAQNALIESGQWLAEATSAKAVVFGHIHDPVAHGVYKNTGSFAFPKSESPGRSYIAVHEEDRTVEHRFYRAAG